MAKVKRGKSYNDIAAQVGRLYEIAQNRTLNQEGAERIRSAWDRYKRANEIAERYQKNITKSEKPYNSMAKAIKNGGGKYEAMRAFYDTKVSRNTYMGLNKG